MVHFAAETHVDRSIADAGDFFRTNVLGLRTGSRAEPAQGPGVCFGRRPTVRLGGPVRSAAS
ncbi:hypothetical protein AQJ91_03015 [Streptomyces dysideae]|uniref:NAD(P)-binding domain-containing protein n=1 Tax=Streptomyces dysideae TaxID=909626 RepID=A0A101V4Z0_9ACTN|nr:hypothetical protein AQJ91_03015 [Streptomyces dysideae]